MTRWILWLLGGLLLGGVVHLSTVLALPRTAAHDAYARLLAIAPVNKVVPLPTTPAVMPFMDPAFATAVCRYDLSRGAPLWVHGPDENANNMGLKPLISGERSEDEGLFVVQHEYWVQVMRDALQKEQAEALA